LRTALIIMVTLASTLIPAFAGAQQADERAVEFGAGLHYVGAVKFDGVDATENAFGGATRAVFKSRSDLDSSPGVAVNIGLRLTAMLQAEWSVAFNHTQLSTHLSGDEEAGTATVTEPVTQYLVEGGVRLRRARRSGAAGGPFATAGIGYLRQLHDGNTLVDTGPAFYVGGGMDFLLNGVRVLGSKTAGIRADVRGLFLGNDLTLDGATHVVPVVGASLFFRF
jgi:hypothetical protein